MRPMTVASCPYRADLLAVAGSSSLTESAGMAATKQQSSGPIRMHSLRRAIRGRVRFGRKSADKLSRCLDSERWALGGMSSI